MPTEKLKKDFYSPSLTPNSTYSNMYHKNFPNKNHQAYSPYSNSTINYKGKGLKTQNSES